MASSPGFMEEDMAALLNPFVLLAIGAMAAFAIVLGTVATTSK